MYDVVGIIPFHIFLTSSVGRAWDVDWSEDDRCLWQGKRVFGHRRNRENYEWKRIRRPLFQGDVACPAVNSCSGSSKIETVFR